MQTESLTTPADKVEKPGSLRENAQNPERQDLELGARQLLVFELAYGGHYASYIRHLAEYWRKEELPGYLNFVVSPTFVRHHPDVIEIASSYDRKNLNFVSITPGEEAALIPRKSFVHRALRSFQEWKLLRKYATLLKADSCLLLYFDSFQAAIASGASLPCSFSGIYFRPTFHYNTFAGYVPTWKNRLQHWREKYIILPRVMHHPRLRNLFCLDPFVIRFMERFGSQVKTIHLPDPVQVYEMPQQEKLKQFRTSLGIEPGRQAFLLFGALYDGRKGIRELLEAISTLSPSLCQKLCLLLVGQIFLTDESPIQKRIAEITQSLPVQIVVRDGFIPEREVQLYFQSADVILAPYQRHVGMSGTLVQAAAAQKPLLVSDYGLMGEIAHRWQLGLTVDSTVPSEIAKGITQFLLQGTDKLGDRAKMKAFAEQNSAENFASSILQHLLTA
ncbi:MAG: glycosyltransferase [Hydrococcus sp. C42_A2020_068]|uniref:glycosyltransferase n=1 Tax=Pleurocapsa sp. PCC 7327 TaxID=118163 RepID=UPI00029FED52|nr:glycosyltransferase [Pleurocapsa sp. PCC 7327]AFY76773.1 glycosyltransferase [Pleurocapsa sp. PCC 7327]MBF2020914.1 glycosyltransferase [Hydrococcus sp. C42_A2020_068]